MSSIMPIRKSSRVGRSDWAAARIRKPSAAEGDVLMSRMMKGGSRRRRTATAPDPNSGQGVTVSLPSETVLPPLVAVKSYVPGPHSGRVLRSLVSAVQS
jgi:hypothetical protein